MSDDFHKFMFLGAMIGLAMFSGRSVLYNQGATAAGTKLLQKPAPLFVLSAPASQGVGGNVSAEGSAIKAAGAMISGGGGSIAANADPSSSDPVSQSGPQASVSYNDVTAPTSEELLYPALQSPASGGVLSFKKTGSDGPPQIGAAIALVADLQSGEEFLLMGKGKRWPIASITKLVTAAVAWDLSFTASTTLTDADFPPENPDANLKSGGRYTVADLMRLMLMESNNIAAEALANFSNRDQFLAAMNAKAAEWGIGGTNFTDPTGLSPANQSTADDLLRLAVHIYAEYPDILRTTKKLSTTVTELNSGKRFTIKNIDLLASRPDFLGGKTGYIDESSGNLLSLFLYEHRPVFVLVMGTEDRFGDVERLINWFEANYR